MNQPLKLTDGQQTALDKFVEFLMNPHKTYFVLEGYAGTGKSTLVRELLDRLPKFMEQLEEEYPDSPHYEVALTATTNKAAEVLSEMSGMEVSTIHSFLGLRVWTDYKARPPVTKLVAADPDERCFYLLFIDEASYVDFDLLKLIKRRTANCKIVFMGDRGQIAPVKSSGVPPVFTQGYDGAMLTEVMRQMVDGVPKANPITELATAFRLTVAGDPWPKISKYVGEFIKVMNPEEFNEAIMKEFTRDDWRYNDSKLLGWTNRCVIGYNNLINEQASGTPHLEVSDYAVCNKNIAVGNKKIATDALVKITEIEDDSEELGCPGNWVTLDGAIRTFFPKSLEARKEAFNRARNANNWSDMQWIDREWVDLRHAYAQTVNKSQGSTYDRVYIVLADIMACNSPDQCARMLYVAVSRARNEVIFLKGK